MNKEEAIREIQRLNDLYIKEIDEKILYSRDVVNQLIFAKTYKLEQALLDVKQQIEIANKTNNINGNYAVEILDIVNKALEGNNENSKSK